MTFPRQLREAGYETAFIGKWHMGLDDSRRPGFDTWISSGQDPRVLGRNFDSTVWSAYTDGTLSGVAFDRYAISGRTVLRKQTKKLGEHFSGPPEPDRKVVGLRSTIGETR